MLCNPSTCKHHQQPTERCHLITKLGLTRSSAFRLCVELMLLKLLLRLRPSGISIGCDVGPAGSVGAAASCCLMLSLRLKGVGLVLRRGVLLRLSALALSARFLRRAMAARAMADRSSSSSIEDAWPAGQ